MSNGIFYTAVKDNVKNIIYGRGNIYAKQKRTSDDFKWLAARTVYATATVKTKGGQTASGLGIPSGGGFGDKGLYSKEKDTKDSSDTRMLPKSHITAVKLGSTGDWGSVKTCELSFTCYSLGQLNSRLAFMELGAELTVNYGWGGDSTVASSGTFEGKIWNFDYGVNSNGGWDCTVKAMGKGIDAVSGNIKGGQPGESITDPSGLTVPSFDVLSRIKVAVSKAVDLQHGATGVFDDILIGCLEFASSWGSAAESTETSTADSSAEPKEDDKHYYVNLESIVKQIQLILLNPAKNNTTIKCDATVTLSPKPSNAKYLISANPKEVIFPGYNKYGDKHDFNFDSAVSMYGTGGVNAMRSSNIMISIEWLGTILSEMGTKADGEKAAQFGIAKFLSTLFDSINANSGKRIQLSLTNNPDVPVTDNGKEWWIVDVNYKNGKVTPLIINAFNNYSVVRSISINSAVSDTQATVAYVTPGSTTGDVPSMVFGENINNRKDKEPTIQELFTQLEDLKKLFDAVEPPTGNPPSEVGPTSANVTSMQSVLTSIFTNNPDGKNSRIVPYPLTLSVTIDGVEGIIFGNVITTNYMPDIFFDTEGSKVVFSVTTVEHNISITDWTTTINTVCRMPL